MNRVKTNNQNIVDSRAKKLYYPIQQSGSKQNELESLRQMNAELLKKEELYIQKLMKLQEGLQRQYIQFMTLQELYGQLLQGYKRKEQEINNLQQLYRQTQRKRNQSVHIDHHRQYEQNNKFLQSKLDKMHKQYQQLILANEDLKISQSKLISQLAYLRNKEKMNDSRASLESKVLQQLGQWQKQLDEGKEQKIKLLYQNSFLRQRNKDLQQMRKQLEKVLQVKQKQISKLRQQKISIIRQSSQSRISRSASPNHSSTSRDDLRPSRKILDSLRKQNLNLQNSIKNIKQNQHSQIQQIKLDNEHLHPQFFSFSRDDKSEKENYQSNSYDNNSGMLIKQEYTNNFTQDLPNFPAELQIEQIIGNKQKL